MTENKTKNKFYKIISIFFFLVLFGAYIRIYAISSPYQPGATLDPACTPTEVNCTVIIYPDQTPNANKLLTTNGNITAWANNILVNTGGVALQVTGNIGTTADDTYNIGSSTNRYANVYTNNLVATTITGSITPAGFTSGSVIFSGTSGTLNQDNANFFYDKLNHRLGIGTTTPSAALDVGGKFIVSTTNTYSGTGTGLTGAPRLFLGTNAQSGDDSAILIGRALTGDSLFSHAVRDESTFNTTTTGAYASFDSIPAFSGSTHYNHLRSFQARPQYSASGIIDRVEGFTFQITHNGTGTITDSYGLHVSNALGTGPITNQAGIWIDDLTRGTNNYAIYSPGTALAYFGGRLQAGGVIQGVTLKATGLAGTYGQIVSTDASGELIGNPNLTIINGELDFKATLGNILAYHSGNVKYGMGVTSGNLRFYNPGSGNITTFGTMSTVDGSTYTEQMRIDGATGKVGIGTTSPGRLLELSHATAPYLKFNHGTVSDFTIGVDTQGSGGFQLYDETASAYRLTVAQTTGNVGIGTASPGAKLDVRTTRISGTNATALVLSDPVTGVQTPGFGNTIQWQSNSGSSVAEILMGVGGDGTNNQSEIRLRTQNVLGGIADRLTVSSAGNVGIGTTSPTFKSDIENSTGTPQLRLTTSAVYSGIRFDTLNTSAGSERNWFVGSNASAYGDFTFRQGATQGSDPTLGTDRLYISNAGNVGIGTTSPTLLFQVGVRGGMGSDGVFQWGQALTGNARGVLTWDTDRAIINTPLNLDFQTAGFNRLRIDSAGNVGIGTSTPYGKLVVNDGTNRNLYFVTDATQFATTGMAFVSLNDATSAYMPLSIAGSSIALMGGNVGIGTTSPSSLLTVQPTNETIGTNKRIALFQHTSTNGGGSGYITVGSDGYFSDFESNSGSTNPFRYGTYTDTNIVNNYVASGGAFGNINFVTGNVGGSSIVMTIGGGTQKGNVGIGTTTPNRKLEVYADGGAAASHNYLRLSTGAAGAYGGDVSFEGTYNDYANVGPNQINNLGKLMIAADVVSPTDVGSIMSFYTKARGGTYATAPLERMRILANGNVGIGTTSPNQKLEVAGIGRFTGSGAFSIGSDSGQNRIDTAGPVGQIFRFLGTGDAIAGINVSSAAIGSYAETLAPSAGLIVSGNVGIGTASPQTKLSVQSVGNTYGVTIGDAGSATGKILALGYFLTGDYGIIEAVHQGTTYKNIAINPNGGNVGIGTSTPHQKLEVAGVGVFTTQDNAGYDPGGGIGPAVLVGYKTTGDYGFINAVNTGVATKNLALQPGGGNVGVGTITPTAKLHIVTDNSVADGLHLEDSRIYSSSPSVYQTFAGKYNTAASIIDFSYLNGGKENGTDGSQLGFLRFATNGGSGNVERIRINSSGNVGIGRTVPLSKLDVYTGSTGPVLRLGGVATGTSNDASLDFYAQNGINVPTYARVGLGVSTGGVGTESGYLTFSTINTGSLTEKMRISESGNVGIGTVNPTSLLHVAPNLTGSSGTATGIFFPITINQSGTAGYNGMLLDVSTATMGSGTKNVFRITSGGTTDLFNVTTAGNVGIGQATPTSKLDITTNALGTTQTTSSGLALVNTTAAALGLQQISPSIRFTGQGWKTDVTAASQSVDFRAFVTPVQGAANPTGYLGFGSSINGGAYTDSQFNVLSSGLVSLGGVTASFPGLKRNSTGLDVRLADDSAYAPLTTGALISKGASATSADYSFQAQNSSSATILNLRNDGYSWFGGTSFGNAVLIAPTTAGATVEPDLTTTGRSLSFLIQDANPRSGIQMRPVNAVGTTSGNYSILQVGDIGSGAFAPSSGSAVFAGLRTSVALTGSGTFSGTLNTWLLDSTFAATVADMNGLLFRPTVNVASGTSNTSFISIKPTISAYGSSGNVRGILYDPTIISMAGGGSHIAFENTSGDVKFNTISGNTMIGTSTNNGYKLDVNGTLRTVQGANFATTSGFVGISNASPGYLLHVGSAATTTGTTVARFQNAGGTCDIVPSTAGGITCTSDMHLKKNITTLDGQPWTLNSNLNKSTTTILDRMLALTPVKYNMLVEEDGSPLHTGFIAQEVEQFFPDLVRTDIEGRKSVNYAGMMPYTVKALEEMDIKLNGLSSLDTNNPESLGSLIKKFMGDMGNSIEQLFVKKVHTEELCVKKSDGKEICITGDQLDSLMNHPPSSLPSSTQGILPVEPIIPSPQEVTPISEKPTTPLSPDAPIPVPTVAPEIAPTIEITKPEPPTARQSASPELPTGE